MKIGSIGRHLEKRNFHAKVVAGGKTTKPGTSYPRFHKNTPANDLTEVFFPSDFLMPASGQTQI
jgi:hypothetical protein